jgi:hypothetical protein
MTWLEKMEFFLNSDHCPNFVKAGVEKAKIHVHDELINNEDENDQFNSSVFDNYLLLQNLDNDPNLRKIPFSLTMSYHHL